MKGKTIIETETDIQRVLNSPLIIPGSPDRTRLLNDYQGKTDTKVIITVTEKVKGE